MVCTKCGLDKPRHWYINTGGTGVCRDCYLAPKLNGVLKKDARKKKKKDAGPNGE